MKRSHVGTYSLGLFLSVVIFLVIPVSYAQVLKIGEPSESQKDSGKNLIFDNTEEYISRKIASVPWKKSSPERPSIIRALRNDIVFLLRQPDFYAVVGGLCMAPSLIEYEAPEINHRWMKSAMADHWFETGETLGNAAFPFTIALVSYSLGEYFHSPKTISFASDLLRANVINSMLTVTMKVGINRRRPDGAPYGFPSGHTSHAFATAGVMRSHFGPWLGSFSEVVAAYVSVSRLQENKHYLSDVFGGAILGSYVAYRITHRSENSGNVQIAPVVEDKTYGVGMKLRF